MVTLYFGIVFYKFKEEKYTTIIKILLYYQLLYYNNMLCKCFF